MAISTLGMVKGLKLIVCHCAPQGHRWGRAGWHTESLYEPADWLSAFNATIRTSEAVKIGVNALPCNSPAISASQLVEYINCTYKIHLLTAPWDKQCWYAEKETARKVWETRWWRYSHHSLECCLHTAFIEASPLKIGTNVVQVCIIKILESLQPKGSLV